MTTKLATAKTHTIERRRSLLPPGVEPAPDILDDDMPDPMHQHPFYFDIVEVLRSHYEDEKERTLVDGDYPVYYRDRDGVQTYFKPDCGVTFDVDTALIYERNGYFIEEIGKPPNFVMEIGSKTTASNDTGPKRDLYEWLKIPEYFGFDGTGGEHYGVPLFGWRLRGGIYVPVETTRRDDGSTWAYSEQLGLYFCAEPALLRAWDPRQGRFLRRAPELERALRESERERLASAARILELEELLSRRNGA